MPAPFEMSSPISAALAAQWSLLAPLAMALHYFNLLLFIVLSLPWLTRWIAHRDAALATLKHPVQASFYPTFSIAMLVIAAQFLAFGPRVDLALLFHFHCCVIDGVFEPAVAPDDAPGVSFHAAIELDAAALSEVEARETHAVIG